MRGNAEHHNWAHHSVVQNTNHYCLDPPALSLQVLGAGKTDGAMDAANLLKPMLARGELRCIGATTLAEYRQHMEKDAAFERRFQQVLKPHRETVQAIHGPYPWWLFFPEPSAI